MRCHTCKAAVEPVAPRTIWKIGVVGFWFAAMLTATVFSLLLGLNIVLVPLWFAIGASVGVAARRASTWTCPRCHEEMAEPVAGTPSLPVGVAPSPA